MPEHTRSKALINAPIPPQPPRRGRPKTEPTIALPADHRNSDWGILLPHMECAPSGRQIAGWELTETAGLSKDESHGQAPHLYQIPLIRTLGPIGAVRWT
jgi:hypothetical protein